VAALPAYRRKPFSSLAASRAAPRKSAGFTLIELAVTLFIVTLILASLLAPLGAQVDQRKNSEAQKALDQISEALLGYALSQTPPRLPCPDTNNDGIEDAGCPIAVNLSTEGNVPWVTLGTPPTDPWGQRYRYRVSGPYTDTAAGFTLAVAPTLGTPGDLRVCATAACAATVATTVPAVIWSRGPNGAQGAVGPDEVANNNNDRDFVSRIYSTIAGDEFDDLVTWLSKPILLNRMVMAQKLP